MAIDIRATITCSLGGSLISGSISDDYVQGTGLIKTRGEVELYGLIAPRLGTAVTFSYTKGGITRTIPRKLRVLSSFADPFRGTTKVQLGCQLTYKADIREPYSWKPKDDPANTAAIATGQLFTPPADRVINFPIYAQSVMNKCLEAIGLTASASPLTNVFNLPEFDYSPGYVQVLSDLLISECYCGFLNESEELQIINLAQDGGTGPVLTAEKLIDVAGIGVGELPSEAITVNYSTLKLERPTILWGVNSQQEEEETQRINWERTESTNGPITNTFYYTDNDGDEQEQTFTGSEKRIETIDYATIYVVDQEKSFWYPGALLPTIYLDELEVRVKSVAETTAPLSSLAGNRVQQILDAGLIWRDYDVISKREETQYFYDSFGNQTRVVKSVFADKQAALGALDLPWVVEGATPEAVGVGSEVIEIERTTEEYENSGSYTKVETKNYLWWPRSQAGQQAISQRLRSLDTGSSGAVYAWLSYVSTRSLVFESSSTVVSENGAIPAQGRPSNGLRVAMEYAPSGNPNDGYKTSRTTNAILAMGVESAGRVTEFSMPYAPDDIYIADANQAYTSGIYISKQSDAEQKAKQYGIIQNRLVLGNRQGMNIQTAPEWLPRGPFMPFTVSAGGLSALYRTNGTSWTMSAEGLVVSTDALFWGATGATGNYSIYVPVAPGITTLPPPPAVTDTSPSSVIGTVATVGTNAQTTLNAAFPSATTGQGVQDTSTDNFWVKQSNGTWTNVGATPGPTSTVTTVVPVANETVVATGTVRSKVVVTSFRYALDLLTQVPIAVRTTLQNTRTSAFTADGVVNTSIASVAPRFETSVDMRPPVADSTIEAWVPIVGREVGIYAAPAAADLTITAYAPNVPGAAWHMRPPAAYTNVTANLPAVGRYVGVYADPPSAAVTVAALAPTAP